MHNENSNASSENILHYVRGYSLHFKRIKFVRQICDWKGCNLTYQTCIYEKFRFLGSSGSFSGQCWPAVGPKSQNWSRQRAWGYSVVKIDLFWCATLGSRRIYHFGSFSGHFGPDSVPVEGHGWVHSNILVAKKWKEAIGLVFEWLPLNELPMNEPLFYARFLLYYLVPFFSY